jgi:hypothetical protein
MMSWYFPLRHSRACLPRRSFSEDGIRESIFSLSYSFPGVMNRAPTKAWIPDRVRNDGLFLFVILGLACHGVASAKTGPENPSSFPSEKPWIPDSVRNDIGKEEAPIGSSPLTPYLEPLTAPSGAHLAHRPEGVKKQRPSGNPKLEYRNPKRDRIR